MEDNPSAGSADNIVRINFAKNSKAHVFPVAKNKVQTRARSREKLSLFEELLEQGVVMLILDARHPNVDVPSEFSQEYDLRLNFSYRFGLKDFTFDQSGVEATLSFSHGLYFCRVPWSAVFAIQSHASKLGSVWTEDVPTEIQVRITDLPDASEKNIEASDAKGLKASRRTSSHKIPKLRLVQQDD